MNWHSRYKAMLRDLDISHKDVADIIGSTHNSERSTMQPSKPFPKRAKLAVWVYEQMKNRNVI